MKIIHLKQSKSNNLVNENMQDDFYPDYIKVIGDNPTPEDWYNWALATFSAYNKKNRFMNMVKSVPNRGEKRKYCQRLFNISRRTAAAYTETMDDMVKDYCEGYLEVDTIAEILNEILAVAFTLYDYCDDSRDPKNKAALNAMRQALSDLGLLDAEERHIEWRIKERLNNQNRTK